MMAFLLDKDHLAVWGAVLSTILAIIKVWELYRDRMKLEVSYDFKPSEQGGNDIILYNPGKTPVMVQYWELFRAKRFPKKRQRLSDSIDTDAGDMVIAAHSKFTLTFDNENYFSANADETERVGALYIELSIVGRRRTLRKLVYSG